MGSCSLRLRLHDWRVAAAQQVAVFEDAGAVRPVADHTVVLRVCDRCGHTKSRRIDGRWTTEELTRRA